MKQVTISDFRAHIGQYLDDLTEKTEKGTYVNFPGSDDCIVQIGSPRNDTRVLMCNQVTFHGKAVRYATMRQQYDCLKAMSLTTMGTLLHAPALDDIPLTILTSICTLFEAAQNILYIILQNCPYPIFDDLDMRPMCTQQMSAKAPLPLYTFARFLHNTYNPIVTGDEPLRMTTIIQSLNGDGALNLTFNQDILKCSEKSQEILKEAINAVCGLLFLAPKYSSTPFMANDLEKWYATYISENIPMYYNGHIWTHNYWEYQPKRTVVPANPIGENTSQNEQ